MFLTLITSLFISKLMRSWLLAWQRVNFYSESGVIHFRLRLVVLLIRVTSVQSHRQKFILKLFVLGLRTSYLSFKIKLIYISWLLHLCKRFGQLSSFVLRCCRRLILNNQLVCVIVRVDLVRKLQLSSLLILKILHRLISIPSKN